MQSNDDRELQCGRDETAGSCFYADYSRTRHSAIITVPFKSRDIVSKESFNSLPCITYTTVFVPCFVHFHSTTTVLNLD